VVRMVASRTGGGRAGRFRTTMLVKNSAAGHTLGDVAGPEYLRIRVRVRVRDP
jgi:hypothetical protein